MKDAIVSCIVPVYNGERYLAESIDSILAQTYRPVEVIVVDDGSTDRSGEVARSYGEPVRCVRQANAGPAAALNRGIEEASGELLAFLAADDLWAKDKLGRQIDVLASNPELGLCVTHIQNFWVKELEEEAKQFAGHRIAQPIPGYLCVTMLAWSEVFRQVGIFNADLPHGNDLDWFSRAREAGVKMEMLSDVLVHRRLHENNRSRERAATSRDTILQLLKDKIDRNRNG